MRISRRRFLGTSANAAMAAGAFSHKKALAESTPVGTRSACWDLGFMVWRIGDILDFDAQVEWIAQAGFEAISFHASAGTPGKWVGIDPAVTGPEARRRIKNLLARFSMREIHAPFACELERETPSEVVKSLEGTLRFAHDVGAAVVTVHADPPDPSRDEPVPRWHEVLDQLDAAAAKAGVHIGIEFMSRFEWLRKPRRAHIGATLDVGHMYLRDGAGYRPYGTIGGLVRFLDDTLIHLHVHDYNGAVDHIEIGTGRVDFDSTLRALTDMGYQGALCLELNPDRVSPDGIRRSADFLRKRAGELAAS